MKGERRCDTCEWHDLAVTDAGPVIECHLNPPATLTEPIEPIEPPPNAPAEMHDEYERLTETSVTLSFDRYPSVRAYDWCSFYVGPTT